MLMVWTCAYFLSIPMVSKKLIFKTSQKALHYLEVEYFFLPCSRKSTTYMTNCNLIYMSDYERTPAFK